MLLAAGKERDLAIANDEYHCGVPAIIVVVDGGWSKRSHKHSYNTKSGVGVIFGAAKKKLFFIGVRNKYCSVCVISKRKNSPPPSHQCYCNWRWFIGDGDGSMYHAVVTGVPSYGYRVQKVECANHAIKCYQNRLEELCKSNPDCQGQFGLSRIRMK